MIEIWERELEKHQSNQLPVVLPIVLYHGKHAWKGKKAFIDWFGGYDEIDARLYSFIPNFEFLFFDFSEFNELKIQGNIKLKTYLQMVRYVHLDDPELLYTIIVQLDALAETSYFETVVLYVLNVTELISIPALKTCGDMSSRK